jgi:hypothetical protein
LSLGLFFFFCSGLLLFFLRPSTIQGWISTSVMPCSFGLYLIRTMEHCSSSACQTGLRACFLVYLLLVCLCYYIQWTDRLMFYLECKSEQTLSPHVI